VTDLAGKVVLVTGATSGIGLEASVALARMGMRIVMVGRNPGKTAERVEAVRHRSGSSLVDSTLCDLSSQAQVRSLAQSFLAKFDRLDVLVNNAGTVYLRRTVTEDGIEATFAVNYLSGFLLANLLLDTIKAGAPSRIVNVSSAAHYAGTMDFDDLGFERGYGVLRAYSRSKLAEVILTRELAKRLRGTGVTVNSLHPGTVATSIWNRAPSFTRPFFAIAKRLAMISAAEGAQTIVYLATSPDVAGSSGLYFEKNRPIEPCRLARDDDVAGKLWQESARLVHLAPPNG